LLKNHTGIPSTEREISPDVRARSLISPSNELYAEVRRCAKTT
jgi:hypothetical protein